MCVYSQFEKEKKNIDIFVKEFSPMFHGHSDKFLDQLEPLNNVNQLAL